MPRTVRRAVIHGLGIAVVALALAAPVAAQPYGPGMGPGMMSRCWLPDGSWNQEACPWQPGQGPGMMGQGMMGPGMMGPGAMPRWGWNWGTGQGGWGPNQGMMGAPGVMGQRRMAARLAIDADGDGVVSAEEAAAHAEQAFDLLDGDGDEAITAQEATSGPGGAGPRAAAMQTRREARFKAMDRNGDGKVDHEEFLAWHEARFAAADLNKDGKVTVWEFRAAMRRP